MSLQDELSCGILKIFSVEVLYSLWIRALQNYQYFSELFLNDS